jgi:hypothetical protein
MLNDCGSISNAWRALLALLLQHGTFRAKPDVPIFSFGDEPNSSRHTDSSACNVTAVGPWGSSSEAPVALLSLSEVAVSRAIVLKTCTRPSATARSRSKDSVAACACCLAGLVLWCMHLGVQQLCLLAMVMLRRLATVFPRSPVSSPVTQSLLDTDPWRMDTAAAAADHKMVQ